MNELEHSWTPYSESRGLAQVPGFQVAGCACDVRNKGDGRLDMALIYSASPCTVAGVFTTNAFAAAPVLLGRKVVESGNPVHAVVINSGNANACTGEQGEVDARRMQEIAGAKLGIEQNNVLVCSTGRIGEPLPMERIEHGIQNAATLMGVDTSHAFAAADAILTSDTRRKIASVQIECDGKKVHIGAMAKGAGMIEPNMATMLAYIVTDAQIARGNLQRLLRDGVRGTFNAITVDGDMSTNDTVLALANGESGVRITPRNEKIWAVFRSALNHICREMAASIVGDGEKITKVVEICVRGARSVRDAESVARVIGNSLLVKTSWYGNDPNWGRILDAAGYAQADIQPDKVRLYYQGDQNDCEVSAFIENTVYTQNKHTWKEIVSRKQFRIVLDLGLGDSGFSLLASDLTEGYVNFNKSE